MKRAAINLCLWITLIQFVPEPLNAAAADGLITPPKMPNMDHLASTLTAPPISKIIFGKLVIGLEITTLGEVRKSAGVGEIQHRGDAGGSEDWLCYTISSRKRPERIWISSGELGGAEHVADSFYAETIGKEKSAYCPDLPAQLRPVSLSNQLWIGSSLHQLKSLFGSPSMKIDGWWLYSYSGKVPANGFDRLAILGVRVFDGKVVGLFVSQATTD